MTSKFVNDYFVNKNDNKDIAKKYKNLYATLTTIKQECISSQETKFLCIKMAGRKYNYDFCMMVGCLYKVNIKSIKSVSYKLLATEP